MKDFILPAIVAIPSLTPIETTFGGTASPSPAGRGQGEGGLGFSPLGETGEGSFPRCLFIQVVL